jgi:hypothetical protein
MKSSSFVTLGICLIAATCHTAPKVLAAPADAAKIAQVKAGTLKTVNASSWGFDKNDATECLQNAISSGVPTLIVDNTGSDWIINKPLNLVSNQEIIFADGVVIQAKQDCFKGVTDSLFRGVNLTNVTLTGKGKATLRMRKTDYQDAMRYKPAEWRSGISLYDCANVTLRGFTIEKTGGDGLYLGASVNGTNKNVLVENMNFDDNHRQGISVISVDGFLVRNSRFTNTSGTPPQAGIDFEPNHAGQRLVNCVLEDCIFTGNAGDGIDIYAVHLNGDSPPISITVNRSLIANNTRGGFAATLTTTGVNPVGGTVTFNDCRFDHNVIRLGNAVLGSVRYFFKNCTLDFRDPQPNDAAPKTPILLSADKRLDKALLGNIVFDNTTILTGSTQWPIALEIGAGTMGYRAGLSDQISGTLYVKNKKKRKQVDLAAFVQQKQQELRDSDPANILAKKYSDTKILDITKQWRFLPDPAQGQNVFLPTFDDSAWKTIDGGNWLQKQGYASYHDTAWYRKTVTLPALAANQKAELLFDGVDGTAVIYLNGQKLGEHTVAKDYTGWDTPFRFDITNVVKPGENVIAVQVASKSQDTASGIHRPVHLVIGTLR